MPYCNSLSLLIAPLKFDKFSDMPEKDISTKCLIPPWAVLLGSLGSAVPYSKACWYNPECIPSSSASAAKQEYIPLP